MTKSATQIASRSGCPIATSLDLLGDRWTLVIVRDLINGKRRFAEFLASPEQVATNTLASRLRHMEAQGLVDKRLYEEKPQRFEYQLTVKGKALLPVLQDLCRWANQYVPGTWVPPAGFMRRKRQPRRRHGEPC
jgi:DNA-binding HxlR family transcriptional regulator